jgi:hypothetical protein
MPDLLYEKNLSFFRQNSPVLYSTLISEQAYVNTQVEPVADTFNFVLETAQVRCFVHSIYNTEREMQQMFAGVDQETEVIVVFGMGTGKAIDYIAGHFPKIKRVIVVEPDLNLFKKVMRELDLFKLMSQVPSLSLILNKTAQESALFFDQLTADLLELNPPMVMHYYFNSIYPRFYDEFQGTLVERLRLRLVNLATKDNFKQAWMVNILRNLKNFNGSCGILMEKLQGLPAIIVSAGPSLNKNMYLLKEVKDRAVIVAVGTAIRILDSNGIVPHIRMAMDGGKGEMQIFETINTNSATLLYSDQLYYEILPQYEGPVIKMLLDTDALSRYLAKDNYKYELVASGFSIANTALDFLCRSGCSTIIFMGQDLCYTEGKLYAKGSWKTDDGKVEFSGAGYIKTTDIFDNKVYTTRPFMGMKSLFEQEILQHPEIKFIDATEGGLRIENTEVKTLQELVDSELTAKHNIDGLISEAVKYANINNEAAKIEQAVLSMEKELTKISKLNTNRLAQLKRLQDKWNKGMSHTKFMKDFDAILEYDRKLMAIPFYAQVASQQLANIYYALDMRIECNDENPKAQAEGLLKKHFTRTIELREYIDFLQALIGEFKGEYEINIVFG